MKIPTVRELRQFARYHLVRRAFDYPARDPEMQVVSLGYDPGAFERALRASSERFELEELVRVTYRAASRPMFSVRSKHERPPRRRLLVLSGVHGNEQAGILCVPSVLERYRRAGDALASVALEVLTPVNPVGAAELSRFNAEGYDINRDFVRFGTVEARTVRAVIERRRPDFVLSLHEGPQDASFVFVNERVQPGLAEALLDQLAAKGIALATVDYFHAKLPRPGLSPSTVFSRIATRLWAQTLGMMAANAYCASLGIPELTLESSWKSSDRDARVSAHVELCMALLHAMAR